ncbi:AMP-binding protein [Neisseria arctica]|uniref:AMP-binding protein n=1 Tax=Neisseria arctica TaxID=1470200 RepID=A0A0J0YQB2_9NEIS|nr:AMP-binding protein [Neisseria arctica]KLT72330.1 AMP-binding protein [Neisseria arctica]UOO85966.1 AMP-binding protein [Neisseria arctica]
MYSLSQIFSENLFGDDLIAVSPDWKRADFNRTVFYLSGRLKAAGVKSAALWFDDAALFACAVLSVWHAGARVILPPNLAYDNTRWADSEADVWLTDVVDQLAAADISKHSTFVLPDCFHAMEPDSITAMQTDFLNEQAEVYLKTSGSSGKAQVVVKTLAQIQAEAKVLAQLPLFADKGAVVMGSVSPQHLYGFTFRFALPLSAGLPISRKQSVYPENLLAETSACVRTVWITSPALLNRMGEERNWEAVRPKLSGIVSAGGALPYSTAELLERHLMLPLEIYGSTETGVIASRYGSQPWRPLPGVAFGQSAGEGALWVQSPWSDGKQQTADVVEKQEGGFLLLGRSDRIIKFEDKRVSLAQIEQDLLMHEWVADAYCGIHPKYKRLAVWVALSEMGIAALREHGRAVIVSRLKRHTSAAQDMIAVPRYWRFADILPRNTQAKIAAADFQTAFTDSQTTPVWPSEMKQISDNEWLLESRVPLDLVYFGGHFANFPLVPGVVELQWVRDAAARFDWGRQAVVCVENLKYQQFLRPHDSIKLSLKYDGAKNKLTFKLENQEAVCASGRIVFGSFSQEAF